VLIDCHPSTLEKKFTGEKFTDFFLPLSYNGDSFRQIFDLIKYKNLHFRIRWMPSHLQPFDVTPPGVGYLDVVGNNFADVEAGRQPKPMVSN